MSSIDYMSGFGNYFESEAEQGALPKGQNSPKKSPMGLYPEQLSGSAFTMERTQNLRSWLYRIRPSVCHSPFEPYQQKTWVSKKKEGQSTSPNQMRWSAPKQPSENCDFIDGMKTWVTTATHPGVAGHKYQFNKSMVNRFFYNSDGELLIIPEQGTLEISTEFGLFSIEPQEIAVIPRGIKFQVQSKDTGWCRGYVGENSGLPLTLPDLGPLGANALAHPRDFMYPVASYIQKSGEYELISKFDGAFWRATMSSHPLDVVAWHGNYAPYKYDLRRFNTMGTVSYDHPDPSIYTVLTSPSSVKGQALCDFVIFPPRWLVGENTFRPPYYHRNMMNEYMGLIHGVYDAKKEGFVPGGSSLHNSMIGHGPDGDTFENAISHGEGPEKVADTMAFMLESCEIFHPTDHALQSESLQKDYYQCWQGLTDRYQRE